ncbi:ribosomal protein S5 domain 2-type protein [Dichomitus squalens]|uniref:Ribosomal protein S5 domain 2-type protein n=1 Tax=Dichomitus squalens TaxID=114155 RepID=A0A4Q9NP64_9APHY|nr:ribosomal protein S5 domain 2-type protein [Dichomitus squalens]TBU53187.1 ribosomal protein S5 domain 2-type protein [Dichomitus squalens]
MTFTPDTVDDLITQLSTDPDPSREAVALELGVLQSIYGEKAVQLWKPPSRERSKSPDHRPGVQNIDRQHPDPGTIRYEVTLEIDSVDGSEQSYPVNILVSLPPKYPTSAPPQLQLLSRYIGPFGVDAPLFGTVLRTYISQGAVEWAPGGECVFDGLEWVKERCVEWLRERFSERKVGQLLREDERARGHDALRHESEDKTGDGGMVHAAVVDTPVQMPTGINIFEAEPIQDRKSSFVGRACRITDPAQVPIILAHLMSDRRIARAAHPIINAWRCRVGSILHQDNDDDGETAAGGRLAHLLQILEVDDVLVVVTRYFGGIHLGPDRFKHINQAARNALELGGFLDVTNDEHGGRRHGKSGRGATKR